MRPCLRRSSFHPIGRLQVFSLLLLCLAAGALSGPADKGGRSGEVRVAHLKSIACRDGTTGIEFEPLGICFDVIGDLYVVDSDNSRIYVSDADTGALSLWSECPSGYSGCEFIDLAGNEAGGVYVSERPDGAIMELDLWGELGAYIEAGESVAGIGRDKAGRVFAAMGIGGSIRMVDFGADAGALETKIAHAEGNAYPVDCHVLGDGTVLVTDSASRRLLFLSGLGKIRGVARGFDFGSPFGVTCVDDRLILVADSERGLVAVFDAKGEFLYAFGEGILKMPTFLDSTPEGLVCVSDAGNMTIEVFKIEEAATD